MSEQETPKPPDFLFGITIMPTFNVAQAGINLGVESQFSPIVGTVQVTYDFLVKADDQRLVQAISNECYGLTQELMRVVRDQFGPELVEHLTGAMGVARKIARERNGKANLGLPPQDNSEQLQAEE